jgi:hypothetical protein
MLHGWLYAMDVILTASSTYLTVHYCSLPLRLLHSLVPACLPACLPAGRQARLCFGLIQARAAGSTSWPPQQAPRQKGCLRHIP